MEEEKPEALVGFSGHGCVGVHWDPFIPITGLFAVRSHAQMCSSKVEQFTLCLHRLHPQLPQVPRLSPNPSRFELVDQPFMQSLNVILRKTLLYMWVAKRRGVSKSVSIKPKNQARTWMVVLMCIMIVDATRTEI